MATARKRRPDRQSRTTPAVREATLARPDPVALAARRRLALTCAAMLLAGLFIYGWSLRDSFVFDDEEQIVNNLRVHSLDIGETFIKSTWQDEGHVGNYYKPLMTVYFGVLYAVHGPSPVVFHLAQLLIHVLNACLVLLVLRRFFGEWVSAALAGVFLLHPINAECVLYASDAQDVLFFVFGIAGLYVQLALGPRRPLAAGLLAGLFVFTAMLAKETGAMFLPIAGVLAWLVPARLPRRTAWVSLWFLPIYFYMRFGLAHLYNGFPAVVPIATHGLGIRLLTLPSILLHYVTTAVFPKTLTLMQHWIVEEPGFANFWGPLLVDLGLLGGLVSLGLRLKSRVYWCFFGWLAVGLGAHAQILPLDGTVADRWAYLGAVGVLGMLGESLVLVPKPMLKRFGVGVTAVILTLLAGRSFRRSMDWRNGLILFGRDLKNMPPAFDVANNYAVELFRVGRYDLAEPYLVQSVRIAPTWDMSWNNLGAIRQGYGDCETSLRYYANALSNASSVLAYKNTATLLYKMGRLEEANGFMTTKTLMLFPTNTEFLQLYSQCKDGACKGSIVCLDPGPTPHSDYMPRPPD